MSSRDAPLWVRCQDLNRWLFDHVAQWPAPAAELLGRPLMAQAQGLWCAVARARAFPRERPAHLRVADEHLAGLRTLATVAPLEAAAQLFLGGETAAIGRMLGGWRKHVSRGGRDAGREVEREVSGGAGGGMTHAISSDAIISDTISSDAMP